jgi:spore coat protein CotH
MGEDRKLVKQFDQDNNGRLDAAERKEARQFLQKEREEGRGGRGSGGPFGGRGGMMRRRGPGGEAADVQPGAKVSVADVQSAGAAPLYDPHTLRTFFLEFENDDWEKELEDFHGTDVEVPAKLTVDGKVYPDVGVHFRGMSSYGSIGEGRKRSLNVTVDYVHKGQSVSGHRTLNLLNGHEDPTFLRPVLFYHIAREYIPAPKANFAKVVINGENWGVYNNVEQFNKDFVKDRFGTTKGARWKVRGNPGGQGRLAYLGDDPKAYKGIYTLKTKDDPKSWAALINLCKVLDGTPADQLEQALAPILDIDGALKFIALDIVLINNDGYWIRTSDYSLYLDEKGRFHVIPQDANETLTRPGGPGFGPPGGGRGGGFGPGMMLAPQMLTQGDKDSDGKLSKTEFTQLAQDWFAKLDPDGTGKLTQDQFSENFNAVLPGPAGFRGGGGPRGGRGGFGPGRFVGPGVFTAADSNKDDSLTREEWTAAFEKWWSDWDKEQRGALDEENLRTGLAAVLPAPNFGGRGGPGGPDGPGRREGGGGGFRGGGGGRGFGGFGGRGPGGPGGNMPAVEGVKLDPLLAANDPDKPLISKLLAVPSLRQRYLKYVQDIAEKWLDWNKLGPIAQSYHDLIAAEVRADTRKLDSFEDFEKGLSEDIPGGGGFGPGRGGVISLKNFCDQRRAYLLNHPEVQKAAQ